MDRWANAGNWCLIEVSLDRRSFILRRPCGIGSLSPLAFSLSRIVAAIDYDNYISDTQVCELIDRSTYDTSSAALSASL